MSNKGTLNQILVGATAGDAITKGEAYYGIAEKPAEIGDPVRFIGYGTNSTWLERGKETCDVDIKSEGFGVKREGTNKLAALTDTTTLRIEGWRNATEAEKENAKLGESVSIAPGDSGGPWIACRDGEACDTLELVGVNSTGNFSNRPRITGQGTRLQSDESRFIIRKAVLCDEPDRSHCAANFKGSGINSDDPTPPSDADIFMKIATADPANIALVNVQVSVPATGTKAYFCKGKDFENCNESASMALTFERDTQVIANKIYRINDKVEMSLTDPNFFSIVGRDGDGNIKSSLVVEVVKK